MSRVSEKGNGRALIQPSARRSIHHHGTFCPFRTGEDMVRYGLTNNRQKIERPSPSGSCIAQDGEDEIDNVMSKFAHPSRPVSTKRNEARRNSFDLQNHNYSDDSDAESNLLSKSSPAILSLCSYYSDEAEYNLHLNSRNVSTASSNGSSPQIRQNESRANSVYNTPLSTTHFVRRNVKPENNYQPKTCSKHLLYGLVIAVIGVAGMMYYNSNTTTKDTNKIIYDKYSFYNDVNGLGEKYKIHDNSILQVRSGIATIFDREDTGSFIFAYNSEKNNFNLVHFDNFVNELALAAARYLRNSTKIISHVVVDTSNLQVQTDKELMNEYLEDVDRTGVMLVKELDKIPSTLAMAFHYYCDEYNPLVKRSAIFFTLNMARCSNVASEKHTHEKIEKCLADKWNKMPHANIRPLLTRVVNVVIDVTSDF